MAAGHTEKENFKSFDIDPFLANTPVGAISGFTTHDTVETIDVNHTDRDIPLGKMNPQQRAVIDVISKHFGVSPKDPSFRLFNDERMPTVASALRRSMEMQQPAHVSNKRPKVNEARRISHDPLQRKW